MTIMNKEKEIEKIKKCVGDLIYDKTQLKKAYNYYHCKRDPEQFRHLEDNYGIGTPTSVGFTPLIKKHIDVLVGEYLELDPDLQVSCKDKKTVSDIMRDKQLKIDQAAFEYFKKKLENSIVKILLQDEKVTNDPFFEEELAKLKKSVSDNYISEYEIAAQNILNYVKNSRDIDLKNKMRELFTDLLIGGVCYYRVKPSSGKNNLSLEILNPLDTFVERNYNEYYLNRSPRAIVRKWMTQEQILNEYDDELSSEAKAKLKSTIHRGVENTNAVWIQTPPMEDGMPRIARTPGILGGLEVMPLRDHTSDSYYRFSSDLIPVYECEWIEFEKGRLVRHEGVKIGEEIYIARGESDNIVRSVSNPEDCTLTINGIFFNDKNGDPFSLILSTMDMQDRYDLVIYYRDSLLASAGTIGDWVDVNHLPDFLGNELPERLQKWIAYKKQGMGLFDSSQEGAQLLNTTFNGFDDTIKAQVIQAFDLVIQSIEQQASSVTGVFAEKLGGIQQRDAVSNVKVGIKQSTLLTKQYFSAMDLLYKEVNYDMLNLAKIVYKHGICGTIINGNKLNQIFTALPEHYTMTDFDIHIQDSTETYQAKESLKASSMELIKTGLASPEMIVEIITARNITDLKSYIKDAVKTQKEETNALKQMQQQAEQMQQQLKDASKQISQYEEKIQQLQKQLDKNSDEKLEIEKKRVAIEEQEMKNNKDYNDKIAKTKERQVDIEVLQLTDNNPYNDKVKDI